MWTDICLENREAILEMITAYTSSLEQIREMIEQNDHQRLFETFRQSKLTRDSYCN